MADDNTLIIKINGSAEDFIKEIDKVKKETASLEKVLEKTAKASAIAFAAFAGSIAAVTKEFAAYETALVGVGKTTNIEGKKLQKFGKEFQKLSKEIPVSTNELLGIAQAAGQLGVTGEKNLLKFTETIAKLGVATDLTGEEAATALTRILNVTGEGVEKIDEFGSVIVRLGNNFAATESEIVRTATEVSRSTAVFDVSSSQAAALATALRSVGVQAALGGSAVGRAFRTIDGAVRDGGQSLEILSRITGQTGEQLKQTFETDSTAVFQSFVEGLGRINEEGGSTTEALAALGLQGDEILKVLPVLAKNSELVGDALAQASDEVKNTTALNQEAEKAFSTLTSQFGLFGNSARNAATNIGAELAPQVTELLASLTDVLNAVSELDKETLSLIATFIKWGAIITGVIASLSSAALAFLKLKPILAGIKTLVIGLSTPFLGLAAAIAGVGLGLKNALETNIKVDPALNSVDKLDQKLKSLRKTLDFNIQSALDTGKDPNQSVAVNQIKERIALLEEERKRLAEIRNKESDDFGTGEFLVRPAADAGGFSVPDLGLEPQTQDIPLRPVEEAQEASTDNTKKEQDDKTEIIDEATQKRIDLAKRENEALKQLQQERNEGATEEEIANLERRQAIAEEFAQAEQIKNKEERDLAIANLSLKNEKELAELDKFDKQKQERRAQAAEQERAFDAEFAELKKEDQALIDEEDQLAFQEQLLTKRDIEAQDAQARLQAQIQERNKFKQDEFKFGTEVANLKKFFAKEEVQGVKSTSAQLAQLSRSRNSTLKGIGKAAARVNAAIATSEGAIKAYTSLAGIPLVGPALGIAAAAALTAFGVEQQAQISAAQTGGFVPPAQGGARDRVPTLLEPNELVVPSAIAPNFIQAAGIPDTQSGAAVGDQGDTGTPVIEIMLEDRAGEVISLEQREGRTLGLIGDN